MTKAANLPKGSRAIFDTNIFIYFVTAHRDFGPSCKAIIRRVEKGEIEGIIPSVVMNELLHNFILIELINKDLALDRGHAIALVKHNPSVIQNLTVAWDLFKELPEMGFTIIEDGKGITDRTYFFSKELSLMAKDAAIVSYAHTFDIAHIVTNDHDFERIPWLTTWKP
ncbi:MAG: type II toxin-antitoxin system VapC family toxin [Methanomicrobiales archaeon]